MVRQALLGLLGGALCSAQAISVDAGAPGETACAGAVWKPGTPGYTPLGKPPYEAARYGTAFACSVQVPNGIYTVDVRMIEPNKTGPGLRRFTIAANGSESAPIDLYAAAGLKTPHTVRLFAVVNSGALRLDFRATAGNALVSGFTVSPFTGPRMVVETVLTVTLPLSAGVHAARLQHLPAPGSYVIAMETNPPIGVPYPNDSYVISLADSKTQDVEIKTDHTLIEGQTIRVIYWTAEP